MASRVRANGLHFRALEAVIAQQVGKTISPIALADLVRWGYVIKDGGEYRVTPAGRSTQDCWKNLKDVSE